MELEIEVGVEFEEVLVMFNLRNLDLEVLKLCFEVLEEKLL